MRDLLSGLNNYAWLAK